MKTCRCNTIGAFSSKTISFSMETYSCKPGPKSEYQTFVFREVIWKSVLSGILYAQLIFIRVRQDVF